ncbi:MAG: DUF885 domain-containing protein [Bifidobacteriaceae bacterium]|nr:DUF885 domain-containing protein [Bifidobacteriaceae bacterium]
MTSTESSAANSATPTEPTRPATQVDQIANRYADELAGLSPIMATQAGVETYNSQLDDFSPSGHAARHRLAQDALRQLDAAECVDATDQVTVAAMRERLGIETELFEAGEHLRNLNNVACPVQDVRSVFDLMPRKTADDWAVIAARLAAVPASLASYRAALSEGQRRGMLPALRQVRIGIGQAQGMAGEGSFFDDLIAAADAVPPTLAHDLATGAAQAKAAYGDLADFLADHLAPSAPDRDAVGRERYELASRYFLGSAVDLDEAYAWGLDELARVAAEQQAVAEEIGGPGTSVQDAIVQLDKDPRWQIHGTDALRQWMADVSQAAMDGLAGSQFDVTDQVRRLECMIAPTHDGIIYYTGPSQDFSRPGRMWWSVPEGVTDFATWHERTTVYHEGVPGHHMQVALATANQAELNRWRRMFVWVSGHGEGWALYAERLMDALGYLPEPSDRFGMLDAQRLRSARVVFDIGVHLELPAPAEWGGGTWTPDKGWAFLRKNVAMEEAFLRFEFERYLGWAGQAPSYKLGERLWTAARDAAAESARAAGREFDIKQFHMRALRLGSLGLDVLRDALTGTSA